MEEEGACGGLGKSGVEGTTLSLTGSVSAGEGSGFSEPGLERLNWKVGGRMHALPSAPGTGGQHVHS